MVKTARPPQPGEILLKEFMEPRGISQTDLAAHIGVPFERINGIVNGRRAISPDTALRLAKAFGTEPEFWLRHQMALDLWSARRSINRRFLNRIGEITGDHDSGAT